MKMVFTLACSAAMICNFAHGQDTTLAKIDKTESTIKTNAATEMEAPVLDVEEASPLKKNLNPHLNYLTILENIRS